MLSQGLTASLRLLPVAYGTLLNLPDPAATLASTRRAHQRGRRSDAVLRPPEPPVLGGRQRHAADAQAAAVLRRRRAQRDGRRPLGGAHRQHHHLSKEAVQWLRGGRPLASYLPGVCASGTGRTPQSVLRPR